jgi:hypothetical protein
MMFSAGFVNAAERVIKAKASLVEGRVTVISAVDRGRKGLTTGMEINVGDRIMTGKDGYVEIIFDTQDVITIDPDTSMTVKELHANNQGDTTSIFQIAFGTVKSAVLRDLTPESKFEYHTKAAIAGIAGSPPFTVTADESGKVTAYFFSYEDVGLVDDGRGHTLGFRDLKTGEVTYIKPGYTISKDERGNVTLSPTTQQTVNTQAIKSKSQDLKQIQLNVGGTREGNFNTTGTVVVKKKIGGDDGNDTYEDETVEVVVENPLQAESPTTTP